MELSARPEQVYTPLNDDKFDGKKSDKAKDNSFSIKLQEEKTNILEKYRNKKRKETRKIRTKKVVNRRFLDLTNAKNQGINRRKYPQLCGKNHTTHAEKQLLLTI
jgi:hypothetical protein